MLIHGYDAPGSDDCCLIALALDSAPDTIPAPCDVCGGGGYLTPNGRDMIREIILAGGHYHRACNDCCTKLMDEVAGDEDRRAIVGDSGEAAKMMALRRDHIPPALREGGFVFATPDDVPRFIDTAHRHGMHAYHGQIELPDLPPAWWRQ